MNFEKESPVVMGELSSAFAAVLGEAKVAPRASDMVSKLKLDKTHAWHIAEIAAATVPLLAGEHVPGDTGLRTFLKSAGARGTTKATQERAKKAVAAFYDLLKQHAGDRILLSSMMADLARRRYDSKSYETARREAYRNNVAMFGFSATTQFQVDFLAPGSAHETLDFAVIRAFVGLTRYHVHAAWHFGRTREHKNGVYVQDEWPKPLEPESLESWNAPLIPFFCTQPLARFFEADDTQGGVNQYVTEGPVGLRGAFDLVLGEYARSVGHIYPTEHDNEGECFAAIYTPVKMFVHDLLIHRDLIEGPWRGVTPECILFNELHAGQFHPHGDRHKPRLPLEPRPSFIGPAEALPVVPELPQHRHIVDYTADKLGLKTSDFTAFRLRMTYPPIPSTAAQRFILPMRRN